MATKAPTAATLRCKQCGAPIELRGGPRSRVVVCAYCDSATDLTDPDYNILWRYEQQVKYQPVIPLGTRGTVRGEKLECIGYMRRSTEVDGERFGWSEYLLYNPYKGYRWLVEDEGKWSLVRESMALPTALDGALVGGEPPRANLRYCGRTYKHFQTSRGRVDYVIGEFYWAVSVGQETSNTDYILPPYILSAEISEDEITWSAGEHLDVDEVYKSFDLAGAPSRSTHVGANEPNPVGRPEGLWVKYFMFCALAFLITVAFSMKAKNELVFRKQYAYNENVKERSFVTDYFTVPGSMPADLEVKVASAFSQRWCFYHLSLISDETSTAYDFGIETASFSGVEDGESWSEGNSADSVVLPHVPPGKYYLRIEPESGTTGDAPAFKPEAPTPGPELFTYIVEARSDVVLWSLFWYATLLMLPFPIIQSFRRWAFESRRWVNAS